MVTRKQHAALESAYARIVAVVRARKLRVRVPRLRAGLGYTVGALMLIYFFNNLGKVCSMMDLRAFLTAHGCSSHDPQLQHLGMQNGFRFLVHNGIHPRLSEPLRQGQYCLLDLRSAHPSAPSRHRCRDGMLTESQFARLRKHHNDRCAVCGSLDGHPHFKNALLRTTIERGHADPRKPLTARNCIPMCHLCNRAYKDKAAFNARGLVVGWLVARRT